MVCTLAAGCGYFRPPADPDADPRRVEIHVMHADEVPKHRQKGGAALKQASGTDLSSIDADGDGTLDMDELDAFLRMPRRSSGDFFKGLGNA